MVMPLGGCDHRVSPSGAAPVTFRALTVLSPRSTCERLTAHARGAGRTVVVVATPLDDGIDAILAAFGKQLAPGAPPPVDLAALERILARGAGAGATTHVVVEYEPAGDPAEPSDDPDGRVLRRLRDTLRATANDRLEIVLLRGSTSDESE